MNKKDFEYDYIIVESFISKRRGKSGVHIRPLPNQDPFLDSMHVECSKELSNTDYYPLGTKFRIKAKIKSKSSNKATHVYSNYNWDYEVLND